MKKLWEFLLILLLGVPMMIVGYFGTFLVFGIFTGHKLYLKWHGDSEKTSP